MQTYIDLDFADGNYRFALPLARLNAVQEKCGPIFAVFGRVANAQCSAADAIEIVREALIGGKRGEVSGQEVEVTPAKANQLVRDYLEDEPLFNVRSLAEAILTARMFGYEAAEKKSPKAETEIVSTGEKSSEA